MLTTLVTLHKVLGDASRIRIIRLLWNVGPKRSMQ